jgi:hypothetical protein
MESERWKGLVIWLCETIKSVYYNIICGNHKTFVTACSRLIRLLRRQRCRCWLCGSLWLSQSQNMSQVTITVTIYPRDSTTGLVLFVGLAGCRKCQNMCYQWQALWLWALQGGIFVFSTYRVLKLTISNYNPLSLCFLDRLQSMPHISIYIFFGDLLVLRSTSTLTNHFISDNHTLSARKREISGHSFLNHLISFYRWFNSLSPHSALLRIIVNCDNPHYQWQTHLSIWFRLAYNLG